MQRDVPRELFRFLLDYPEAIRDLFEDVRNFVLDVDENVYEMIWDNYNALAVAYSRSGKLRDAHCHIAAYGKHVNLGFNQGIHIPDPHRLLVGNGKLIRHIAIKNPNQLDGRVGRLIREAWDWSKQLTPIVDRPKTTITSVQSISEKRRRPRLED